MAHRNENILDVLVELPWWVSVLSAGTIYLCLKWIVPAIPVENFVLKAFSQASPKMAIFIALVFLVPAPLAAINTWRKKQLLDNQKDIQSIRNLHWKQFEELVAEIFRRKGYTVIENVGTGPDGGVDVYLKKDGNRFIVQCKHWKSKKVGVSIVREMFGVMTAAQATGVIIITSGFFTQDAKRFSKGHPIELIEANELVDLIHDVNPNIKPSYEHSNKIEANHQVEHACPKCNSNLVIRMAKRGKNAGKQFFGCSRYPTCRYTKNLRS